MNEIKNSKEILPYLSMLNKQIETFIRSAIELNELDDKQEYNFKLLGESFLETPKCWEVMNCGCLDCPNYESSDYRCWLKSGTLCGGKPQGTFAQKYGSCYSCKVFSYFKNNTIQLLYENISIIVQHLGDKANQARELAIKDNLTGLYNRNYLNLIKERELKLMDRRSSAISIIVFDLNKFKIINDTYGHLTGDKMLQEFSLFLQKYTRGSDLLFRLGGDEFLLFMTDINKEQRKCVEQKLLSSIAEWNEDIKERLPEKISFSIGGTTAHNSTDFEELMRKADEKMYAHKKIMHKKNN